MGPGGKVRSPHFISQHKIKEGLLRKSPPSEQFYLLSEGVGADHCILLTVSHLKTYSKSPVLATLTPTDIPCLECLSVTPFHLLVEILCYL